MRINLISAVFLPFHLAHPRARAIIICLKHVPGESLQLAASHEYLVPVAIQMQASGIITLARHPAEVSGKCTGETRDLFSALLIILQ
jgi:hypothetical protein